MCFVETKRKACYCVLCPLQHVIHLVQNRHALLRAGGALERDIKQRKLLFFKLMMLAVCRLSCFSAPLLSNMAVFYHVNDYNQAQKSLTHLSKTGAFIHNFIHILFHSVLRRKSPLPRINVVCGKIQTWGSKKTTLVVGKWKDVHRGEGDRYVHCSKRGHFIEVSQHVSLIVAAKGLLRGR